jgi:hypothetical protein
MCIPIKHQATPRAPLQLYELTTIDSRRCLHVSHYYVLFVGIIKGCVKETVVTIVHVQENYKESKLFWHNTYFSKHIAG